MRHRHQIRAVTDDFWTHTSLPTVDRNLSRLAPPDTRHKRSANHHRQSCWRRTRLLLVCQSFLVDLVSDEDGPIKTPPACAQSKFLYQYVSQRSAFDVSHDDRVSIRSQSAEINQDVLWPHVPGRRFLTVGG